MLETQAAPAERYALTAYDAAYLDLAPRKGVPLATQDKALSEAARLSGPRQSTVTPRNIP